MKHFQSSGLWFPTDDLSNAVGGTLHYDSEGLTLRLFGSFHEAWSAEAERYPIIRGVVDENPYGLFVTLFDCLKTHSHYAGITSETIRCGKATIGSTHLPDGPFQFESLEVHFSYLNDWVGQSGLKFEVIKGISYSVNYTEPEMLSFPFRDKRLTLVPWLRTSRRAHRVSLDEETIIRVSPIGERSSAELVSDHIQILQNLLSFATDTPNEIEDMAYRGTEDSQGTSPEYSVVFEPIFRINKDKARIHSRDMLFSFADAQNHIPNIFQIWLDFTVKNPTFCTAYFANLYAESLYMKDKFVGLMQAFTFLSASIGEVSERTRLFLSEVEAILKSHFGDEERKLLGHIIPTGPEMEMPHHLLRLLQENADTMGPFIEDMPGFVKSVSDTLAFFEQRSQGARAPFQGADLYYAMLKIRTLIKVLVLRQLGFDKKVVRSLVMRNSRINFLRAV